MAVVTPSPFQQFPSTLSNFLSIKPFKENECQNCSNFSRMRKKLIISMLNEDFLLFEKQSTILTIVSQKNKIALSNEERPTTYNFLSTARRQKTVFFFLKRTQVKWQAFTNRLHSSTADKWHLNSPMTIYTKRIHHSTTGGHTIYVINTILKIFQQSASFETSQVTPASIYHRDSVSFLSRPLSLFSSSYSHLRLVNYVSEASSIWKMISTLL